MLVIKTVLTPEIGDAAFRGNARTSEEHNVFAFPDDLIQSRVITFSHNSILPDYLRVSVSDQFIQFFNHNIIKHYIAHVIKPCDASVRNKPYLYGKVAVEKVRASAPGYYDAILMDIQMPVMDGYAATREIRSLKDPVLAAIPILAMTANAFPEDIKAAEAAGMQAHIAKPIDISVLKQKLGTVLIK